VPVTDLSNETSTETFDLVTPLEPRLVFDGAAANDALDGLVVDAIDLSDFGHVDTAFDFTDGLALVAERDIAADRREVIFVDASIANLTNILGQLPDTAEIQLVDASTDGIAAIANWASTQTNIDAIHIISHGAQGELYLGSSVLSNDTIAAVSAELTTLGGALTESGDILLYGCNIADGAAGLEFVERFAQATSADVAASSDDTGTAVLGGDWDLEVQAGDVDAESLVLTDFDGVLAVTVADQTFVENESAVIIDPSAVVSTGGAYNSGYVEFNISSSVSTDRLTVVAGNGSAGTITVSSNVVTYHDPTSGGIPIGTIDSVKNGLNGQPLRVNFYSITTVPGTSNLANGDFSNGTTGWNLFQSRVNFGSSFTVNGVTVPTPTDAQMAAVSHGTSNDNTPSTASSLSVGVTNGALSLNTGSMTIDSYGIYHGPAAVSNAFFADAGDVLQFDYSASANGDDYHVAGYLYNTSTNQIVMALNDTGRTASGTAVVNVPTSSNYRFVFIVGTYDASGGRAAGASMTIDNIRAEDPYSIPSSAIQQFVRSVAYQSTSEAPAASKSINITTNNGSTSSTDTSVVSITAVNDAPVLGGTTFNLTTISEDDSTNAGQLVSAIVGTAITDVDASPVEGIAITGLTESAGNGVWQYQLSGSSTWVAVGAVDATSALLLGANDKIRFLPDETFGGTASFTFNAWDQTSGTAGNKVAIGSTGGTTAFSTASKTANITVTSIDDAPVLTASATGTEMLTGTARAIAPGLTITDVDSTILSGAKVSVSNLKSGDLLDVSGTLPAGITASYSASTGVLTLSGSASLADYQAALRAVTFDTTSTDTTDRTFDFSLGEALAFSGNGHYYEFVSDAGIEWADAKAAAEARTFLGMQGYLVTVTSAEENAFVASKLAGEGWMGASDATTEGAWYWVTGPEAGTKFWQGTSTGTVVGDQYNNWASGEPNDSGSNEDHAHFLSGGTWNDYRYNNSNIDGYVVEYGTSTSGSGVASLKSVVSTVTRADLTETAIEWGTARNGAEAVGNALYDNVNGGALIFKLTDVKPNGGTYSAVTAGSTSASNPITIAGLYGTLTIGEDGSYSYDPADSNAAVQGLNAGDTLTDSFVLKIVDANGDVDERTLVMTIDGTNDAPVAIDATASVNEDAATNISGTLTSNDVDNTNAERTYTLDAPVAGLTLATDGSWTFDAGDDAYQYLQAGETLNVVANFTVEDAETATDGGTLTITVTGVNDAPAFGEVSGITSTAPTSGSGMARSTTVGTGTNAEVFLGGKFIEVGIHSSGSYGTSGSAPVGFFGTSGSSQVGLSNDVDGYGIGNDYRIDYFLPGSPAEGFAIGVNGTSYENYGLNGSQDLTGTTVTDLSDVANGILSAKISGTTPEGLLMEIIVSFGEDASYFNTEVTLTNTTTSALTDVRYIRGFDPDNTKFYGGSYTTDNEIVATVSEDGYAVVKATSLADNYSADTGAPATVLFYSADPRARTSIGGNSFQISDVYGSSMLTDLGENGQRTFTDDVGISIGFEEATLAAGASTTFSYVTSLDNADVATTLSAISGAGFNETNAPLSESGTIAVSDVDLLDEVTAAITNVSAVFDDGTEVDLATAMPALFTAGQGMFTISPVDPEVLISSTETTDNLTWAFDSGTETFDFLAKGEKITFTYTITVTDSQGATATQDVDITINGTNDAPVVEEVIPETVSVTGAQISYPTAYAFSDIDASDVLVYSASGLPPGMTIDPETGIISGSSIVPDDYTVIITATDPFGGTVDAAPFILKVVSPPAPPAPLPPANDGPPAGPADIFTPEVTTDTVLKKTAPGKGLSKPAGEPNGGGMPAAGGSTGMVSAATLSTGSIAIARPLPDMGVTAGPVGFIVPRDTFITTASSLSLSASLADGSALPEWLQFNAETGEFSGTPPEGYEGELDLMVKARDSNGGEASTSFTLTVGDLAEQDAKLEILDWDSIETDFASVETGKAVKGAAPLSQVLKATRIGVGAVSFDTVIAAE
jgi:VCBS repeat-containing protein